MRASASGSHTDASSGAAQVAEPVPGEQREREQPSRTVDPARRAGGALVDVGEAREVARDLEGVGEREHELAVGRVELLRASEGVEHHGVVVEIGARGDRGLPIQLDGERRRRARGDREERAHERVGVPGRARGGADPLDGVGQGARIAAGAHARRDRVGVEVGGPLEIAARRGRLGQLLDLGRPRVAAPAGRRGRHPRHRIAGRQAGQRGLDAGGGDRIAERVTVEPERVGEPGARLAGRYAERVALERLGEVELAPPLLVEGEEQHRRLVGEPAARLDLLERRDRPLIEAGALPGDGEREHVGRRPPITGDVGERLRRLGVVVVRRGLGGEEPERRVAPGRLAVGQGGGAHRGARLHQIADAVVVDVGELEQDLGAAMSEERTFGVGQRGGQRLQPARARLPVVLLGAHVGELAQDARVVAARRLLEHRPRAPQIAGGARDLGLGAGRAGERRLRRHVLAQAGRGLEQGGVTGARAPLERRGPRAQRRRDAVGEGVAQGERALAPGAELLVGGHQAGELDRGGDALAPGVTVVGARGRQPREGVGELGAIAAGAREVGDRAERRPVLGIELEGAQERHARDVGAQELLLQRREPAQQRLLPAGLPRAGRDLATEDRRDPIEIAEIALQQLQRVERGQVIGDQLERGLETLHRRLGLAGAPPVQLARAVERVGAGPG